MKTTAKIVGHFMMGTAVVAALTAALMWLWNWLLPAIFGIAEINFWQALGLLALSKILFGGFKFGGHHCHRCAPHTHNKLLDKWQNMSDEERETFKNQIKWRHQTMKI